MNNVFEFDGRSPKIAIPMLFIGIILFVLAVAHFFAWAFLAAIPIGLFLILHVNKIKRQDVEVSATGLEIGLSKKPIPWSTIRGVWCKNLNLMAHRDQQPMPKRIVIEHDSGYLELYDDDVAKVSSFLNFVLENVKPNQPNLLQPVINSYLHQEQQTFGENLITVCRQAPKQAVAWSNSYRFSGVLTLMLLFTTIGLWIAFGIMTGDRPLPLPPAAGLVLVLAVTVTVMTVVCSIAFLRTLAHVNHSKYSNSALVISPRGFALSQKDLDGSMAWNEIKGLKNTRHGLVVKVAGAQLIIVDIYDLPLTDIYQRMKANC